MTENIVGYEISLYFDAKFFNYLKKNKFTSSNKIDIIAGSDYTPEFIKITGGNHVLYLNDSFSGVKRSLTNNFSHLDFFVQKQNEIFQAIKEAKESYLASLTKESSKEFGNMIFI